MISGIYLLGIKERLCLITYPNAKQIATTTITTARTMILRAATAATIAAAENTAMKDADVREDAIRRATLRRRKRALL